MFLIWTKFLITKKWNNICILLFIKILTMLNVLYIVVIQKISEVSMWCFMYWEVNLVEESYLNYFNVS